MWRTPNGDRDLTGAEARLFRDGVLSLVQHLDSCTDQENFANLTTSEKLVALAYVVRALFDPRMQTPKHHAWSEATICAVYRHLAHKPAVTRRLRQLVRDAIAESFDPNDLEPAQEVGITDACHLLSENILWDCDFEMEDVLAGASRRTMKLCRIDRDYFCLPPAASPERVAAAKEYLAQLNAQPSGWHARSPPFLQRLRLASRNARRRPDGRPAGDRPSWGQPRGRPLAFHGAWIQIHRPGIDQTGEARVSV